MNIFYHEGDKGDKSLRLTILLIFSSFQQNYYNFIASRFKEYYFLAYLTGPIKA